MRTSWQKYLPPNWAPMPVRWASSSTLASSSTSRKAWPAGDPVGGELVEVVRRGELGRLDGELRRRAADHDGQVVRRAGGGAERLHLVEHPRQQRRLVEQRLGLLEQVALVGAAAALGDEQELVGVAVDGGDLDLGRQVGAGVDLVVHRERRHLAVAQVAREVRAAARRAAIAASSPPPVSTNWPFLPFTIAVPVSWHIGSTPPAAIDGVLQQVEGDEAVVVDASGSSRMLRSCCEVGRCAGSGRCRASPRRSAG